MTEKQRERNRETEREKQRNRERETERERNRERETERQRETYPEYCSSRYGRTYNLADENTPTEHCV